LKILRFYSGVEWGDARDYKELSSILADQKPDPGGQKCSTKKGKSDESCFEVLDVLLLRATCFSCKLNFLQEDLRIKILQFLIKFISNMC
jgi:hypothetical protein